MGSDWSSVVPPRNIELRRAGGASGPGIKKSRRAGEKPSGVLGSGSDRRAEGRRPPIGEEELAGQVLEPALGLALGVAPGVPEPESLSLSFTLNQKPGP